MKAVVLERLIEFVELISAAVLLAGFAKGIWKFLQIELEGWLKRARPANIREIRQVVGSHILLGLDFYIVSDILSTMLRQEMDELASLAVIGLLRTIIGYFLAREIESQDQPKGV